MCSDSEQNTEAAAGRQQAQRCRDGACRPGPLGGGSALATGHRAALCWGLGGGVTLGAWLRLGLPLATGHRAARHWGLGGGTTLGAWWRRGATVGAGRAAAGRAL
jgi:hypothetical protein